MVRANYAEFVDCCKPQSLEETPGESPIDADVLPARIATISGFKI